MLFCLGSPLTRRLLLTKTAEAWYLSVLMHGGQTLTLLGNDAADLPLGVFLFCFHVQGFSFHPPDAAHKIPSHK